MRLTVLATATLLLAQAALAQKSQPPSDGNQAAGLAPEQSTAQVQQAKVQRVLTAAGFTDIKDFFGEQLSEACREILYRSFGGCISEKCGIGRVGADRSDD